MLRFFLAMLIFPLVTMSDDQKIIYSALLPLTGNGAEQGEWCRQGFELAADDLKSRGIHVSLKYEDTRGDAKAAIAAYRYGRTTSLEPVVFTWGSSVAMALSPVTNADKVLQMGVATATPKYRSASDLTFRTFPSADSEALFLSNIIKSKFPGKRLAGLHIENDYGIGSTDALRAKLQQYGIAIVGTESYSPDTTDFRSLLLRLSQIKPEVIYLASYPNDGALILRQAREVGLASRFIGSVALAGVEDLPQLAGRAADGLMLVSTFVDPTSDFAKNYRSKFNDKPTAMSYAARSYDALQLVAAARMRCIPDHSATCLAAALGRSRYKGASGTITFDDTGDAQFEFVLNRVENGLVVVDERPN